MILYGPFRQLVSMHNAPLRGALADEDVDLIENAGIVVSEGIIIAVGAYSRLLSEYSNAEKPTMGEGMTVMPGFVDAHTHLCWAADRTLDYALRVAGKSYLEIAEAGGGIWSSVLKTREADENFLAEQTIKRANRHLRDGVTTIEVKSGYGLSVEAELRLLRAIKTANESAISDLIPTCLAAHMKPRDFAGTEREYLDLLLEELLPEIKRQGLSDRVDIFIEQTAFDKKDSLHYLQMAAEMGFDITVHADQFSAGGSEVGLAVNARSVDHLEASGEKEVEAVALSNTFAVALPGASLGLGMAFTPARKILDLGGRLAIASDWNPGSAPMGDLVMQAAVLGTYEKLTIAETLAGITFRAAEALGLSDRGRLVAGKLADFQAYETDDFRSVFYHQGRMKPELVWKKGELISQ